MVRSTLNGLGFLLLAGLLLAKAWFGCGEVVVDLVTRLNAGDTVDDFNNAGTEVAVSWMLRMCKDGGCLSSKDSACGFTIDASGADRAADCLLDLAERVEPKTPLGKVSLYCGRAFAKFEPARKDEAQCRRAGGIWGEMSEGDAIYYKDSSEVVRER